MAEAIGTLISDTTEGSPVRAHAVVIYAPNQARRRFPEGCVTVCASEADALAAARPAEGYHAALASGPSRSSEGFRLYYLLHWL